MENTKFKKKNIVFYLCCAIITSLFIVLEILQTKNGENIKLLLYTNFSSCDSYCIKEYCPYVALNISNPWSYLNKVTIPFIKQLVKNGTRD